MALTEKPLGSPAARSERVVARRALHRRWLALAVALAIVVMLALGWVIDTVASAPTQPASRTSDQWTQAGLDRVSLSLARQPLRAGQRETFGLRVVDTAGAPIAGARLICDLSMPDMFMPANTLLAVETAPGDYTCATTVNGTGHWLLTVSITARGRPPVAARFDLYAD